MLPIVGLVTISLLGLVLKYLFSAKSAEQSELDLVVIMVCIYSWGSIIVTLLAGNYIKNPNYATLVTTVAYFGVHCGFCIEMFRKKNALSDEGTIKVA